MRSRRGTTLTELLAASTIGLVVLVTLGQMDVARVRMYEYIRHGSPSERLNSESGFALADILGDLKRADRVVLVGGPPADSVLMRIPKEGDLDLDNRKNYTWNQYTWDPGTNQIRFYNDRESSCPTAVVYHGVTGLQMQYVNVALPQALGGEPFADGVDNNVVRVTVAYGQRKVWGVATVAAAAYTNLHAGCADGRCDSGDGLANGQWKAPNTLCSNE